MIQGNRLKPLREKAGLTQEEVAILVGYDVTTVCKHENATRRLTEDAIARYSKVYKVPTHLLFQEPCDNEQSESCS